MLRLPTLITLLRNNKKLAASLNRVIHSSNTMTNVAGRSEHSCYFSGTAAKMHRVLKPPTKHFDDWSANDVTQWLKDETKSDYVVDAIKNANIDGKKLLDGSATDQLTSDAAARLTAMHIDSLRPHIELAHAINGWKTSSMSTIGAKMPMVNGDKYAAKIWQLFERHHYGWHIGSESADYHFRLFVHGPDGSGKTKLGQNLMSLLKTHVEGLKAEGLLEDYQHGVIDLLSNAITVRISFAGEKKLLPSEELEAAVVVRGIMDLFKLQISVKEFYERHGHLFNHLKSLTDPLSWFLELIKEEFHKDKPSAIVYLHVDNFEELSSQRQFREFQNFVDRMAIKLHSCNKEQLYFVLFTGTDEASLIDAGNFNTPTVGFNTEILNAAEIFELVGSMHKNGDLPWLSSSWRKNKSFVLSLLNTAGYPRALEYLLHEYETAKMNLDQMTIEQIELIAYRADKKSELLHGLKHPNELWFLGHGLLGTKFAMEDYMLHESITERLDFGSVVLKCWRDLYSTAYEGQVKLPSFWLKQICKRHAQLDLNMFASVRPIKYDRELVQFSAHMFLLKCKAMQMVNRKRFDLMNLFEENYIAREDKGDTMTFTGDYKLQKCQSDSFDKLWDSTDVADHLQPGTIWYIDYNSKVSFWTVFESALAKDRFTLVLFVVSLTAHKRYLEDNVKSEYEGVTRVWKHFMNKKFANYDIKLALLSNTPKWSDLMSVDRQILSKCVVYDKHNYKNFFGPFADQVACALNEFN